MIEPDNRQTTTNEADKKDSWFWCRLCDCIIPNWIEVASDVRKVSYCPNCGAKVVKRND